MKTRYFMLARYAEFAPDGQLAVIGGDIDQVLPTAFPAALPSLTVVTKLTAPVEECSREHSYRLSILGPDGEAIHDGATGTFPPSPIPTDPEITTAVYGLAFNVNALVFPKEGKYKIMLSIDGEEVASAPLRVKKPQDGPPTLQGIVPGTEKSERSVETGAAEENT